MDVKNVVRLYREGKRSNASTYKNVEDWEEKAVKLSGLYIKNFEKYLSPEIFYAELNK